MWDGAECRACDNAQCDTVLHREISSSSYLDYALLIPSQYLSMLGFGMRNVLVSYDSWVLFAESQRFEGSEPAAGPAEQSTGRAHARGRPTRTPARYVQVRQQVQCHLEGSHPIRNPSTRETATGDPFMGPTISHDVAVCNAPLTLLTFMLTGWLCSQRGSA